LLPDQLAPCWRGFEISQGVRHVWSKPAVRSRNTQVLDLADQIERDELENNLPDALNHADEDDLDDEPDTGKPRR